MFSRKDSTAVAETCGWPVLESMAMSSRAKEVSADFAVFVRDVEPRLRQALIAAYGPVDGREATVDALSWAWEHWARLEEVGNRLGYLFI
jgi:hypothetical protein